VKENIEIAIQARAAGRSARPRVVVRPARLGKTTLAQIIASEWRRDQDQFRARCWNARAT